MTCECLRHESFEWSEEARDLEQTHFQKIAVDSKNWRILFKCPDTQALWMKHYPDAGNHGGGVPEYVRLSEEQAASYFDGNGK